ncbi:hypothetical protein BH09PLA1_BH09PLA1_13270 [soil metagenome]
MNDSRPFSRFVHRTHRRRIAWRLIEHAAIGLLIGCAIASVLLLASWWREVEAVGPALAVLIISSVAGIVASIWNRPTLLDTARLIETQLNAPELLSSALLVSSRADDTFVAAVRTLADARVAGATISSLALQRLGVRGFSGVGLALASVVVLALMLSTPLASTQAVARAPDSVDSWLANGSNPRNSQASAAPARDQSAQRNPESTVPMPGKNDENLPGSPSRKVARSTDNSRTGAANSRGSGVASSESDLPSLAQTPEINRPSPHVGTPTVGGAGNAAITNLHGEHSSGVVSPAASLMRIPAWKSEGWPRDRDAAMDAVRSGAIPDPYRSLVQDYFQRP